MTRLCAYWWCGSSQRRAAGLRELEPTGVREVDARERTRASAETLKICERDESVVDAASAREPVELCVQLHTARETQIVFCTLVEHVQRVLHFASQAPDNQHMRVSMCLLFS